MAKIKLMGDKIALVSAMTMEQLKKVKKHRPEALKLKDAEGKSVVFAVDAGAVATMSKYGVVFASQEVVGGKAIYTVDAPSSDPVEVRHYINDMMGIVALNLNKVETQCTAAFADIADEVAAIETLIEGFPAPAVAE